MPVVKLATTDDVFAMASVSDESDNEQADEIVDSEESVSSLHFQRPVFRSIVDSMQKLLADGYT